MLIGKRFDGSCAECHVKLGSDILVVRCLLPASLPSGIGCGWSSLAFCMILALSSVNRASVLRLFINRRMFEGAVFDAIVFSRLTRMVRGTPCLSALCSRKSKRVVVSLGYFLFDLLALGIKDSRDGVL